MLTMASPTSPWPAMSLPKQPHDHLTGYEYCPKEYSLYPDRSKSNTTQPEAPRSCWSSDAGASSTTHLTKMTTPAPFEVPKVWQTAMSMVSVNAGLFPQEVLTQYHRQQPIQKLQHLGHAELDTTASKRANKRGIKAVTIRYTDHDPGNIYLMVILVDEIDPHTKRNIVRLITNTSIRHVLEVEPGANCPLWLRVHSSVTHASSPYQIIPCCEHWIEDLDLKRPISNEEKQVPAVVERLLQEVRRKDLLLAAKEREVQDREDELATLRNLTRFDEGSAVSVTEHASNQLDLDIGAIVQQYWLIGLTVVAIFGALVALK
ncbi:hypothetical protein N0V93_004905 [Gnomoniopsis smithogilvyi]|uniref:Uncharacterized protein n=1 Tax=Gnomoniopsis smithogilvyi TaxID=1191159 RepID=A0A9W8YTB0_9PEZI|nr:hypothetical protein N0V93_004905 [Gnomoniopsis smithogilvyi]